MHSHNLVPKTKVSVSAAFPDFSCMDRWTTLQVETPWPSRLFYLVCRGEQLALKGGPAAHANKNSEMLGKLCYGFFVG